MFSSIRIQGLGPIADNTVHFDKGLTTIARRSQWGKTTVLTALCFALFGTDINGKALTVEAINDDCDVAVVELFTGKGTRIERSINRKRKVQRFIQQPDDAPLQYKREEDFAKAMRGLCRVVDAGRKVHVGRIIAAPMAWRPLATGAGDGRALRDFLAAVLPVADVRDHVAVLMGERGYTLRDNDPVDADTVASMRREANRAVDVLDGEVRQAERRVDEVGDEDDAPDTKAHTHAKQVLRIRDAWDAHDEAHDRYNESVQRAAEWEARRAAVPDAPDFDAPGYDAAVEAVRTAERFRELRAHERRGLDGPVVEANNEVVRHELTLQALRAEATKLAEQDGKCPTCGKKWSEAAKMAKSLERKIAEVEADVEKAKAAATEASDARDAADAAVEQAAAKVVRKQEAVEAFREAKSRLDLLQALGKKPEHLECPAVPQWDRPTDEAISDAIEVERRYHAFEGLAEDRQRQHERAQTALRQAKTKHDIKKLEAERLDALLDAVRRAPSLALAETLGVLHEGGVELRANDKGGLDAFVDGRPWAMASTGRQVAADASLRNALRKAVRMPWFPMFIDNRGAWSEGLPDLHKTGPVVALMTEVST